MHQQGGKGAARRGAQWSWTEPTGGGLPKNADATIGKSHVTKKTKNDKRIGIFWEFGIVCISLQGNSLTKTSDSFTSKGRRFKTIKIGMPNNAKQDISTKISIRPLLMRI